MRLGIVGLPNVGKTTFFNALTKSGAGSANFPFSTTTPNVGVVPVPDERLSFLEKLHASKRVIPAAIEFVDISGLVKGSSQGAGLGNRFLAHIREVDAIVHLVRCFEDDNIIHVDGQVNPRRDIDTINTELILADLEFVERRLAKESKTGSKQYVAELQELFDQLNDGERPRSELATELNLLSAKPVIYAANVSEDGLLESDNPVLTYAKEEGSKAFTICARLEEELCGLSETERTEYLADLGLPMGGLEQLISSGYDTLGLISFLTAGPKETRAWTIKRGSTAPQAAGKIHSDLERGFIRAEIVAFDDLFRLGSQQAAKEAGLVRSEGKEYIMKDGDVVLFRFNV